MFTSRERSRVTRSYIVASCISVVFFLTFNLSYTCRRAFCASSRRRFFVCVVHEEQKIGPYFWAKKRNSASPRTERRVSFINFCCFRPPPVIFRKRSQPPHKKFKKSAHLIFESPRLSSKSFFSSRERLGIPQPWHPRRCKRATRKTPSPF